VLSGDEQFRHTVRPPAMPAIAADLVVQSLGERITHRDETCEGLSIRDHSTIIADGSTCHQSETNSAEPRLSAEPCTGN